MLKVNLLILCWVCEIVGFSVEDVVDKFGIGDVCGVVGSDCLVMFENGEVELICL